MTRVILRLWIDAATVKSKLNWNSIKLNQLAIQQLQICLEGQCLEVSKDETASFGNSTILTEPTEDDVECKKDKLGINDCERWFVTEE